MRNVLILGAVRTPIGTMSGAFSNVSAVELGTAVAAGTMRSSASAIRASRASVLFISLMTSIFR